MIDPVEVLREQAGVGSWYAAQVVDIPGNGKLSVQVDGESAPIHVDAKSVRLLRDDQVDYETFQPKVGGEYEVLKEVQTASGAAVFCWQRCRVKQVKGDFFYVQQDNVPTTSSTASLSQHQAGQSWIVEKTQLRPVVPEGAATSSSSTGVAQLSSFENVTREVVKLDQELAAWVTDADGDVEACLQQVAIKVNLLICKARMNYDEDPEVGKPEVVLVGEKVALRRAKMLLDIHFKHQRSIQKFHVTRDKKIKALDEQKSKYNDQCSHEFFVDQRVSGNVIGKGGQNVKRVRTEHQVEILLTDEAGASTSASDEATTEKGRLRVRIYGETQEQVDRAREELEYVVEDFKVDDKKMVGWVLGKKRAHLNEIVEKSGITSANFDEEKSAVELIGLKEQVDDAKMALESHCTYFIVYKEMDAELEEIDTEFASINGGKPGGKKGKGGGKRDSQAKGGRKSAGEKGGNRRGDEGNATANGTTTSTSKGRSSGGKKGASSPGDDNKGKEGRTAKGAGKRDRKSSASPVQDEEYKPASRSSRRSKGTGRKSATDKDEGDAADAAGKATANGAEAASGTGSGKKSGKNKKKGEKNVDGAASPGATAAEADTNTTADTPKSGRKRRSRGGQKSRGSGGAGTGAPDGEGVEKGAKENEKPDPMTSPKARGSVEKKELQMSTDTSSSTPMQQAPTES